MAVKEANFYMDEDNWSHRTPFVVLDTPAGPTWHLGDPGADHMETWKDIIFGNTNPVIKDFVMPKIQKGEDWTNIISQGDVNKGSLDGEDFMEVHAPGAWVDRPEWPGLEGQIKKHYLDNWNKNPIKDIRFQREAKVASDVEDIMKQFDDMGIFDKMPDVAPGPKKVYDPQAEMAHYNEPDSMMQYAEHVPIEWLQQYREFNRRPNEEHGTDPARYEAIKNHIEQHGITSPLGLEYDPDVGEAYLGEGNTRLNIAEDLGYTHVPLTVFRRVKRDAYHPWKPMGQPGQYITDQYGGFPEYSRPSELGIPTRQARTAAISKNKNKFHTGTIDHMRSLAKRGPLKTHKKDKKAAIDPNHLQEYINKYGPYMYHSTPPENVPSILENGILPKELTGVDYYGMHQPELSSRPDHVYIGDKQAVGGHFGPVLKVDLRKLDPDLINTDEDYMQFKPKMTVKHPSELPGYNEIPSWSESRSRDFHSGASDEEYPTLGEFAENHAHILDQPHWTRESLHNGSVAIRGGVPADAIALNEDYQDHPFDLYNAGGHTMSPTDFFYNPAWQVRHMLENPELLKQKQEQFKHQMVSSAQHEGAMVALYIPKAQAEKLHLDGGEPAEDLHITLAFFEDKAKDRDDWEKAQEIVEQVVREFPPLEGEITGTGRFQTDESEPFIGLVSIHGITALHDKLVVELTDAGFPISTKFAYNPHITLKYMDKDTDDPDFDAELPLKIRFDSATFVVNDKRHEADFDPKASVDLSKPILASRNDRTRADFSKASKFATFGCPNCGGQEFGFGAQCRRCKEFVVTAKRDPDYMFAYYQSGIEVQEYDHNLKYRNILEDLLKRFDMTTNDTGWQDNEHLWTGGEIFRISPKAKFKVKFKQLADPEVQEQALKAIKKHFKAREIQHDLDIDINDKLEEKESATQVTAEAYVHGTGNREQWNPGEQAHFEYHCYQGHDSSDAQAWYRSHQPVTVLRESDSDAWPGSTIEQRLEEGQPKLYKVKFPDGHEHVAYEDELYSGPSYFVPEAGPPPDADQYITNPHTSYVKLGEWYEEPDRADWQHGKCWTYAKAMIDMYPQLRMGQMGHGDHFFAHDDTYAYDSIGRHPLPYLGDQNQFGIEEQQLDINPWEWNHESFPHGENANEEDYERAKVLIPQQHPYLANPHTSKVKGGPIPPERVRRIAHTSATQVMYHVAPRSARESILAQGMPQGTMVSPSSEVYQMMFNLPAGQGGRPEDAPFDTWEVNTDGLEMVEDDMEDFTVYQPIGPERLRLMNPPPKFTVPGQQLPLDKFAMPTDPAVISQLRYRLSQPSWGGHVLEAYINNNKVGEVVVDSDGIISSINSWMPRRGIATEMLNELDRRGVKWEHSTSFSDSGKGLFDSLHPNEDTKWAPDTWNGGGWERLSSDPNVQYASWG